MNFFSRSLFFHLLVVSALVLSPKALGCALLVADEQVRVGHLDARTEAAVEEYYLNYKGGDASLITLADGQTFTLNSPIGKGHFGTVFPIQGTDHVVKIANTQAQIKGLAQEWEDYHELLAAGFPVGKIYSRGPVACYLVKDRIHGPSAKVIHETNGYSQFQISDLARLFVLAYEQELHIDTFRLAENLIWSQERFVLVDAGLTKSRRYINAVSPTAWMQGLFPKTADRDAFRKAIEEIRNKDFYEKVQAEAVESVSRNHAYQQELEMIFGGGGR